MLENGKNALGCNTGQEQSIGIVTLLFFFLKKNCNRTTNIKISNAYFEYFINYSCSLNALFLLKLTCTL